MTSYHVSYTIGSTELYKCCFDIDEAYDAVKDIRDNDTALWSSFSMADIMAILVDMKRDVCKLFEAEKLRISVRKGD